MEKIHIVEWRIGRKGVDSQYVGVTCHEQRATGTSQPLFDLGVPKGGMALRKGWDEMTDQATHPSRHSSITPTTYTRLGMVIDGHLL